MGSKSVANKQSRAKTFKMFVQVSERLAKFKAFLQVREECGDCDAYKCIERHCWQKRISLHRVGVCLSMKAASQCRHLVDCAPNAARDVHEVSFEDYWCSEQFLMVGREVYCS